MAIQVSTNEAINEIKGRTKPYVGIMPQSTFSSTITAIETGRCRLKTIKDFMSKFGYEYEVISWRKSE